MVEPHDTLGSQKIIEPRSADLEAFWIHAINAAKLNLAESFSSQDDLTSLRPSSFAFGMDREQANRLCELVTQGKKRATSSYLPSYAKAGVPIPTVGDLSILCDGDGVPRALLCNTAIEIVPFADVDEHVAQAEGEGSYADWVRAHRDFFEREISDLGGEFDERAEVITEFFETLYVFER
ncbi:ASCH domain-containing protein [Arcanobacterium bovis]|nr:ASCH domain-containing protein [Arcanobacterium bovis]